ncbi:hypothetical protein SAMCFNEI73_pA0026 (plasmid) [Sinorhizobium americanum]|uniref:Uncharacterized protein n=1 Tax=Sinorhizobium americanum TaxID=194963 RepID=A0A1L3LSG9_9HYPH|nr:hypothetical protein SAMCFNEI73_pA0026 [Sinorhizobium americanum]
MDLRVGGANAIGATRRLARASAIRWTVTAFLAGRSSI